MRTLALAILLSACTIDTEGVETLADTLSEAGAQCPDGERPLRIGEDLEVEGWSCRPSTADRRATVRCRRGGQSFDVFCDAAEGLASSAAQVGECVIQVWCQ